MTIKVGSKLLLTFFLSACGHFVSAQAPPANPTPASAPAPGVSLIEGKVLRAAGDEPLRGARVELRLVVENNEDLAQNVVTDPAGKFSFPDLKAGKYMLSVRKAGFVTQEYGEREGTPGRRQGTPITLQAGKSMRDLLFRLVPSAVITGRVYDSQGDPMAEVRVSASQSMNLGRESMMFSAAQDTTDDRGEYRLFGLSPGKYVISASPHSSDFSFSRAMRMASQGGPARDVSKPDKEVAGQTYYPGVLDAKSAMPIEVEAGREMPGIDIRVVTVRVFSVRGKVAMTAGMKPGSVHLMLWSREKMADGRNQAVVGADGAFEIPNIQPGTYRLIAMSMEQEGGSFSSQAFGQQEVIVSNADVNDITVQVGGGAEISGRLKIEGRTEIPRYTMVMLMPKEGDEFRAAHAQVKDDGTFQMKSVMPGDYSVLAGGAGSLESDYYLKEARLGGRDVRASLTVPAEGSLTGLEILLAADGGVVSGLVTNSESLPVAGAFVFALPPDVKAHRYDPKQGQADQLGRYELKGLRPGEYKIVAVDTGKEGLAGLDMDEESLKELAKKGKSIQVAASSRQSLDVLVTTNDKP